MTEERRRILYEIEVKTVSRAIDGQTQTTTEIELERSYLASGKERYGFPMKAINHMLTKYFEPTLVQARGHFKGDLVARLVIEEIEGEQD